MSCDRLVSECTPSTAGLKKHWRNSARYAALRGFNLAFSNGVAIWLSQTSRSRGVASFPLKCLSWDAVLPSCRGHGRMHICAICNSLRGRRQAGTIGAEACCAWIEDSPVSAAAFLFLYLGVAAGKHHAVNHSWPSWQTFRIKSTLKVGQYTMSCREANIVDGPQTLFKVIKSSRKMSCLDERTRLATVNQATDTQIRTDLVSSVPFAHAVFHLPGP